MIHDAHVFDERQYLICSLLEKSDVLDIEPCRAGGTHQDSAANAFAITQGRRDERSHIEGFSCDFCSLHGKISYDVSPRIERSIGGLGGPECGLLEKDGRDGIRTIEQGDLCLLAKA